MLAVASAALLMFAQGYTPTRLPPVPTTADYLRVCDHDAKACSDILFDHTWRFSVGERTVGYCLPQKEEDTGKITAAVVSWLKARPALASRPTDASLNSALEALYPCR